MTQPDSTAPAPQNAAATPAASGTPAAAAPPPVAGAGPVLVSAPPPTGRKIRWLQLLLIAAPIAAAILFARHVYRNLDSTKEAEQIAAARQRVATYPSQPDRAYGYWRHLLDDPASSPGLKQTAHAEIQKLIDENHLVDRFQTLIADLLRRGENDMTESTAYARVLLYLSQNYKSGETPAQAQDRIERLGRITAGYHDAINDRVVRGQYDKALEKLTALYAAYPEADFIRPVIGRMQSEVAEAMIALDDLEGARTRLEQAIATEPLAIYRQRLDALNRSIQSLDPTAYIQAGQQAEKEGRWEDAQQQYEKALQLRRSNKEAAAGYTRILKFYAEVFLKNAEENGELSEEGAKYIKLAADNARKMAQYGDPELVLARADLLLAESHFQEEDIKQAKSMVDAALDSIARQYRTTTDGSYLMARIFKLYYHLGKNMNRLPQARQSLALADEYCRLALEKGNPKAGDLFVQIHNLTRIELEIAGSLTNDPASGANDSRPTQDLTNLVNEGPLGAVGPLDLAEPAPANPHHLPVAAPGAAPTATPAPTAPAGNGAAPDPAQDKLLNPLK